MDAFLAIASRREGRSYSDRPLPEEVENRILNAGRLSGSSQNRQPWHFNVVADRSLVERLAEVVYVPTNLLGAQLVVVVSVAGKGPLAFDTGRTAQNMMLAAWNDGVVSSPNGIKDHDAAAGLLGLPEGERPEIVLSFGYPEPPRDPNARSAEEWSRRAKRRPLDEVVRRL